MGRDSLKSHILGNEGVFGHFPGPSAVIDRLVVFQRSPEPSIPGPEDAIGARRGRQDGQPTAGQLGLKYAVLLQEPGADRQTFRTAFG